MICFLITLSLIFSITLSLSLSALVSDITNSVYPCSTQDAIKLAGLQMQVTYGDFNPHIHVAGFLVKSANSNLKSFVPEALYGNKRSSEWEAAIFKEHAKFDLNVMFDFRRKLIFFLSSGWPEPNQWTKLS